MTPISREHNLEVATGLNRYYNNLNQPTPFGYVGGYLEPFEERENNLTESESRIRQQQTPRMLGQMIETEDPCRYFGGQQLNLEEATESNADMR